MKTYKKFFDGDVIATGEEIDKLRFGGSTGSIIQYIVKGGKLYPYPTGVDPVEGMENILFDKLFSVLHEI